MKKLCLISLAITAIMIFVYSCKKNEQVNPLYYNSAITSIQEFFNDAKEKNQSFTIDAGVHSQIEGNKGIEISFSPNSFKDQNGQVVSGNIEIILIEIFTKAEMIRSNKPSNFIGDPNDPNDDNLLVSGGEFYVNAFQNGKQLTMSRAAFVRIPTLAPSYNMVLFSGTASDDIGMDWALINDSTVTVGSDPDGNNNNNTSPSFWYEFTFNDLGWINCDYFWDNTGTQVRLDISCNGVDSMNSSNTVVFIVLPNYNSVGTCPEGGYWDNTMSWIGNGLYSFNSIPVGTDICLLAITKINNDYYYSKINSTISGNNPHVENLQMTPITYAKLTTMINNL